MSNSREHITVFEHQVIRFDKGEKRITLKQFEALQNYAGEGIPYYSLCYNGVRFNHHVGVIQIGNTLIEVLPKADRNEADENKWRNILLGMLKAVGNFEIKSTSESRLMVKPNTILDLYFELFIKEIEYILHNGLVKSYIKKEGNVNSLKGSLLFSKHIQQNLTHQERFFVRHNLYSVEHQIHLILYKTILFLKRVNTNSSLSSRIGELLLYFPEMPDIKVSEITFNKITLNRKTQPYKKALEIAKVLLLKYHPDLKKGRNNVLALMFDMNKLWEKFVYVSLKKTTEQNSTITAQTWKYFWEPQNGKRSKIKPDIIINKGKENCFVIDTKWKNLNGDNPTPDDLRQMYAYHEYYNAKRVFLVYPGNVSLDIKGTFLPTPNYVLKDRECRIILISIPDKSKPKISLTKTWQIEIKERFETWIK